MMHRPSAFLLVLAALLSACSGDEAPVAESVAPVVHTAQVQTSELAGYYAAADGAILVDRFTYEGTLGARTRMLDWLAARVPIVCTRLSEISEDLAARDIALVAECGDASGLERAILKLVADPAD